MKKQTQYFINGLILLILAMADITILPLILAAIDNSLDTFVYTEIEFFLLATCFVYYLFSPKYYKEQIVSIIFAVFYYFFFLEIYRIIFA